MVAQCNDNTTAPKYTESAKLDQKLAAEKQYAKQMYLTIHISSFGYLSTGVASGVIASPIATRSRFTSPSTQIQMPC